MNNVDAKSPASPSLPYDPFAALDDLMCVMEAFCPTWPDRPPATEPENFLL